MTKVRRRRRASEPPGTSKPLAPPPYHIFLTDSAKAVYADLFNKSRAAEAKGDPTNAACTIFRMVREAIKTIIPQNPIDRKYALSGYLANIFRVKKGRYRICWIASSQHRMIFILFISESLRKEGDVHDPYRVFEKMVRAGEFDSFFDRLGIRRPNVNQTIE
jgi:mRNA-degrading endonuclease RelE of RelBE toxin-antitoxin system